MLPKQLKDALDGIDHEQLEKLLVYVRLGEIEEVEVVDDELVITLEFVDTGMGRRSSNLRPDGVRTLRVRRGLL